jgi:E3 ubiquitin-protein ligase synoviolin
MHYYGLPIHIIRDVYMTLKTFISKIKDLIKYREATRDMDRRLLRLIEGFICSCRYPAVTPEELAATDGVCIVCREDMVVLPPVEAGVGTAI